MTIKQIVLTMMACVSSGLVVSCQAGNAGAEASASMSAKDLTKKIQKEKSVAIDGRHITGALDFLSAGQGSGAGEMSIKYVDCEIVIENCVFEDEVTAYVVAEGGKKSTHVEFLRSVTFRNCTFMKGVNFSQSVFRGGMIIDESKFQSRVDFTGAKFVAGLRANRTEYMDEASFVSAEFVGHASFHKAFFHYTSLFQNMRVNCDVFFADSRFGGYVDFSGCYVYGNVDLSNAEFSSRVENIKSYVAGELRMPKCAFADNVTFESNVILGSLVTSSVSFEAVLNFNDNVLFDMPDERKMKFGKNFAKKESNNRVIVQQAMPEMPKLVMPTLKTDNN